MFDYDPILGLHRNCMVVGRAATGIYLILHNSGLTNKEVLVPANICYAAIFPAVYAGFEPKFCDVDPVDGNITYQTFRDVCTSKTSCAIIPHMYGQPVRDLPQIADYCKKNRIMLIEDCASAMGAEAQYPLGQMGDYTVYSTGYSKTMDLGKGGLVCSNHPLDKLEQEELHLPLYSSDSEKNLNLFSKIYRIIRNEKSNTKLEAAFYQTLPTCLFDVFVHQLPENEKLHIFSQLSKLPEVIIERRQKAKLYSQLLQNCSYQQYPFTQGSVPWRMNLLIDPVQRSRIITDMLKQGLPVSDWYPRVTPIFNDKGNYPGAEWHENHILNFPILIDDVTIEKMCSILTDCSQ